MKKSLVAKLALMASIVTCSGVVSADNCKTVQIFAEDHAEGATVLVNGKTNGTKVSRAVEYLAIDGNADIALIVHGTPGTKWAIALNCDACGFTFEGTIPASGIQASHNTMEQMFGAGGCFEDTIQ